MDPYQIRYLLLWLAFNYSLPVDLWVCHIFAMHKAIKIKLKAPLVFNNPCLTDRHLLVLGPYFTFRISHFPAHSFGSTSCQQFSCVTPKRAFIIYLKMIIQAWFTIGCYWWHSDQPLPRLNHYVCVYFTNFAAQLKENEWSDERTNSSASSAPSVTFLLATFMFNCFVFSRFTETLP